MTRRKWDAYMSPAWAADRLFEHVDIRGRVAEPCVGDGALVQGRNTVWTNDIDPERQADFHLDASGPELWATAPTPEWVVTNPPFSLAMPILRRAFEVCDAAMLLRLSFLEPTLDRGPWLAEHPPAQVVVLPRYSFTGDGKTDSVTCAWMVWRHGASQTGISVVPRPKK